MWLCAITILELLHNVDMWYDAYVYVMHPIQQYNSSHGDSRWKMENIHENDCLLLICSNPGAF